MEKEKYESLVSRILKLQKLAEQGEGGEAQNARMAIEAIVNRYGLSLDEILNDNQEKMYKWTVKTAREKQLWRQCLGVVLNTWQPPCYQEKGNSYALLAKLTKLQYAEMSDMYAFHKANMEREYKEMIENFTNAYFGKHSIYPASDVENHTDNVDTERLKKIWKMQQMMDDKQYRKSITA